MHPNMLERTAFVAVLSGIPFTLHTISNIETDVLKYTINYKQINAGRRSRKR